MNFKNILKGTLVAATLVLAQFSAHAQDKADISSYKKPIASSFFSSAEDKFIDKIADNFKIDEPKLESKNKSDHSATSETSSTYFFTAKKTQEVNSDLLKDINVSDSQKHYLNELVSQYNSVYDKGYFTTPSSVEYTFSHRNTFDMYEVNSVKKDVAELKKLTEKLDSLSKEISDLQDANNVIYEKYNKDYEETIASNQINESEEIEEIQISDDGTLRTIDGDDSSNESELRTIGGDDEKFSIIGDDGKLILPDFLQDYQTPNDLYEKDPEVKVNDAKIEKLNAQLDEIEAKINSFGFILEDGEKKLEKLANNDQSHKFLLFPGKAKNDQTNYIIVNSEVSGTEKGFDNVQVCSTNLSVGADGHQVSLFTDSTIVYKDSTEQSLYNKFILLHELSHCDFQALDHIKFNGFKSGNLIIDKDLNYFFNTDDGQKFGMSLNVLVNENYADLMGSMILLKENPAHKERVIELIKNFSEVRAANVDLRKDFTHFTSDSLNDLLKDIDKVEKMSIKEMKDYAEKKAQANALKTFSESKEFRDSMSKDVLFGFPSLLSQGILEYALGKDIASHDKLKNPTGNNLRSDMIKEISSQLKAEFSNDAEAKLIILQTFDKVVKQKTNDDLHSTLMSLHINGNKERKVTEFISTLNNDMFKRYKEEFSKLENVAENLKDHFHAQKSLEIAKKGTPEIVTEAVGEQQFGILGKEAQLERIKKLEEKFSYTTNVYLQAKPK